MKFPNGTRLFSSLHLQRAWRGQPTPPKSYSTNLCTCILSVLSTSRIAKHLTHKVASQSHGKQLTSQYRLPAVKRFKYVAMHRLKPPLFGLVGGWWGRRCQGGEHEFRNCGAVRCLCVCSDLTHMRTNEMNKIKIKIN